MVVEFNLRFHKVQSLTKKLSIKFCKYAVPKVILLFIFHSLLLFAHFTDLETSTSGGIMLPLHVSRSALNASRNNIHRTLWIHKI